MHITLDELPDDGTVFVTLPMPPDYRTSFSGSALPFPREDIAFDVNSVSERYQLMPGDPVVHLSTRSVPNWYYRNGVYGPPFAKVVYMRAGHIVAKMMPISGVPRVPSKTLTPQYRLFSADRHGPVLTQEKAFRLRAMPGKMCHAPGPGLTSRPGAQFGARKTIGST